MVKKGMQISTGTLSDGTVVANLGSRDIEIDGVKIPRSDFFLYSRKRNKNGSGELKTFGGLIVRSNSLSANREFIDKLKELDKQGVKFFSNRDEVVFPLLSRFQFFRLDHDWNFHEDYIVQYIKSSNDGEETSQ